jgi:hypothetical protein
MTYKWSGIFIIISCYLLISFVDVLTGGIVALITKESIDEILKQVVLIELCNSFSLLIIIALYLFKKRRDYYIVTINLLITI